MRPSALGAPRGLTLYDDGSSRVYKSSGGKINGLLSVVNRLQFLSIGLNRKSLRNRRLPQLTPTRRFSAKPNVYPRRAANRDRAGPNDFERFLCQKPRMSGEIERLALRQADQARADFAIIEDQLEAIYARLSRMPTRVDLARVALLGIIGGCGLTTLLSLAFRLMW
jgi:hypothetical protein